METAFKTVIWFHWVPDMNTQDTEGLSNPASLWLVSWQLKHHPSLGM